MAPRLRNPLGQFAKANAEDAIQKLGADEDDITIQPVLQTLRGELDKAEEEIAALKHEAEGFETISAVNISSVYTAKRSAEMERDELAKKLKKLTEDAEKLRLIRDQDLFTDEDEIKIKVAKPEPFDGKSENVDTFLGACNLVFQTSTEEFKSVRARIYYVLSYCTKGSALIWKDQVMKELEQLLGMVATIVSEQGCGTWKAFEIFFRRTWKGISTKIEAQAAIQTIRQGNDSVEEYMTRFRLLLIEADIGNEAAVMFFKRGLKEPIKRRIYDSGNVPKNLDEWTQRAIIIETAWKESELDRKGSGWRPQTGKVRFIEDKKNNNKRLSDEEYQKRRKEGLCYKCGNKGHLAKDCFAKGRRIQEQEPNTTKSTEEPKEDKQDFQ